MKTPTNMEEIQVDDYNLYRVAIYNKTTGTILMNNTITAKSAESAEKSIIIKSGLTEWDDELVVVVRPF